MKQWQKEKIFNIDLSKNNKAKLDNENKSPSAGTWRRIHCLETTFPRTAGCLALTGSAPPPNTAPITQSLTGKPRSTRSSIGAGSVPAAGLDEVSICSNLFVSCSFLCLVPDEAKSSYHVEGTGYDTYLRDAHRQVSSTPLTKKVFCFCLLPLKGFIFASVQGLLWRLPAVGLEGKSKTSGEM